MSDNELLYECQRIDLSNEEHAVYVLNGNSSYYCFDILCYLLLFILLLSVLYLFWIIYWIICCSYVVVNCLLLLLLLLGKDLGKLPLELAFRFPLATSSPLACIVSFSYLIRYPSHYTIPFFTS